MTRAFATAGTRRRLLGLVTGLPLVGLLTQADDEETEARRRRHGRNRGHHPGKHKDNRRGRRKGSKGKGGKGGGGQCEATGSLCEQDSDCCTDNCFNFICATLVTTCGSDDATRQCVPPAKGCAGGTCCYGSAACGETCCELPANQYNPQDECCVANCEGRQCGPDGCGAGGTCGSCPVGETCCADGSRCGQANGEACALDSDCCGGNCCDDGKLLRPGA